MTYTQIQLLTTLRVMIDTTPDNDFRRALKFQLDWLETNIEADAKEIEELKEMAAQSHGKEESYKLNWQIEEKWRKELEGNIDILHNKHEIGRRNRETAKDKCLELEGVIEMRDMEISTLHVQLEEVTEICEELQVQDFENFSPKRSYIVKPRDVYVIRKATK